MYIIYDNISGQTLSSINYDKDNNTINNDCWDGYIEHYKYPDFNELIDVYKTSSLYDARSIAKLLVKQFTEIGEDAQFSIVEIDCPVIKIVYSKYKHIETFEQFIGE